MSLKAPSLVAAWAFAVAALLPAAGSAAPEEVAVYSLHVGVNLPPAGSALKPLKYADDDAVRFHRFVAPVAKRSVIAAVMDGATRSQSDAKPIPPSLAEIERALGDLAARMREDRARGIEVVFLFSYSGHGVTDENGTTLAALDGKIDRAWLEKHIVDLPATYIHLFIDACHAAGIVGQRGVIKSETDGGSRALAKAERQSMLGGDLLARHPNVGVIVASAADKQTHEWSQLGSGVFTYELLSALSGASDVNFDGRMNYSEVTAFMSAANRSVKDPRARLEVVSRPPRLDTEAPILSFDWFPAPTFLTGQGASEQHFVVEAENGVRLLDSHNEAGSPFRLLVCWRGKVWIRNVRDGLETVFDTSAGSANIETLSFAQTELSSRGSISESLEKGLFAHPFGPRYFTGWTDRNGAEDGFALEEEGPQRDIDTAGPEPGGFAGERLPSDAREKRANAAKGLVIGGAVGVAVAGVFTGLAVKAYSDFNATDIEADALAAKRRLSAFQGAAIGVGAVSVPLIIVGAVLWPKKTMSLTPSTDGAHTAGLSFTYRF